MKFLIVLFLFDQVIYSKLEIVRVKSKVVSVNVVSDSNILQSFHEYIIHVAIVSISIKRDTLHKHLVHYVRLTVILFVVVKFELLQNFLFTEELSVKSLLTEWFQSIIVLFSQACQEAFDHSLEVRHEKFMVNLLCL